MKQICLVVFLVELHSLPRPLLQTVHLAYVNKDYTVPNRTIFDLWACRLSHICALHFTSLALSSRALWSSVSLKTVLIYLRKRVVLVQPQLEDLKHTGILTFIIFCSARSLQIPIRRFQCLVDWAIHLCRNCFCRRNDAVTTGLHSTNGSHCSLSLGRRP